MFSCVTRIQRSQLRDHDQHFLRYSMWTLRSESPSSPFMTKENCEYNFCHTYINKCCDQMQLVLLVCQVSLFCVYLIITYFISISKTNDNNKAPEQPIDMRMKKDNKAKA